MLEKNSKKIIYTIFYNKFLRSIYFNKTIFENLKIIKYNYN